VAQEPNSCGTNCCNCCEGIAQETPQETLNRPGLNAIAYRVGAFQQFRDTLLARLQLSRQPFLTQLKARENDDFSIALLDSFSTVADVLTFYTERYQNESYLRTATDRRSILELANLIGYQLRPGVAASTYLAFTLDPTNGAFGTVLAAPNIAQVQPDSAANVSLNVGVKVQSIPGPGQTPQTFETVEAIDARAEWNAITPLLLQQQHLEIGSVTLILSGTVSNLKPGDKILMLPDAAKSNKFALKAVIDVEVQKDGKSTWIYLDGWKGKPRGYAPAHYALPGASCTDGQIADIPANTPLDQTTVSAILSKRWDAEDLVALAKIQNWPLDQLSTALNESLENTQANVPATGEAFVLRQQAAPFGHNAPNYYSLQPLLRYKTRFRTASGFVTVDAAYPSSKNWEGKHLDFEGSDQQIFLDSTYPGILPNSWIVLQKVEKDKFEREVAQVATNTDVTHSAYTLSAKVSQLGLTKPADLGKFPIRGTSILCQSEPLTLAEVPIEDSLSGNVIPLDQVYVGLRKGRRVAISGQRADLPGVTVAEIHVLNKVELACGVTVITLDHALEYTYTRSTVTINANVALATNGETVNETLGNGDGTQAFQSFALRQSPLTYVSAVTPSGTQSTLEVRVNGILWEEVPFFFGHGPEELIFITRQDNNGVSTVTFGDGITGSRLPTGLANVTAQYRRGIGTAAEVNANQLSMLATKPLGVRGVNNPLPASGAADPEVLDDARQNATLTIRALDRIVSIDDYQDFARAFAGISKAIGTWSWNGEQRIVLLTVAGTNGETIDPESELASNLLNAVQTFSEPGTVVRLFSYQPRFFKISGAIDVAADYLKDEVSADVEATLRTAFGFAKRDFGQAVHRSGVIAAIQNVPGVVDVDLLSFYRSDKTQSLEVHISAALPRPGGTDIFAAELLTLDPGPLGLFATQLKVKPNG